MSMSIDIDFRDVLPSARVSAAIRRRARRLQGLHSGTSDCRAWVASSACPTGAGAHYAAGMRMVIAQREVVVDVRPGGLECDEGLAAVHRAFDAAERQIADLCRRRDAAPRHNLLDFSVWSGRAVGAGL